MSGKEAELLCCLRYSILSLWPRLGWKSDDLEPPESSERFPIRSPNDIDGMVNSTVVPMTSIKKVVLSIFSCSRYNVGIGGIWDRGNWDRGCVYSSFLCLLCLRR